LRKWRDDDGFLCGRFELPLEHGGAIVESFFDLVTTRMRPATGEATMCGFPLPEEWVDAARANARVYLRVVDDHGTVIVEDRARTFVSQNRRRAVVRRDGRCRWPGCNRRLRLQVHHLHPSSWGGSDDTSNLASVCAYHHGLLVPHGDYVLDGNPNTPDGLTLRIVTKEERARRRTEEAA
jgi:hypothetical protein